MSRHKDVNWNLPPGVKLPDGGTTHHWDSTQSALLMDIRDELKQLNRTLACYRVSRMSDDINKIDRRLQRNGMLLIKRQKS